MSDHRAGSLRQGIQVDGTLLRCSARMLPHPIHQDVWSMLPAMKPTFGRRHLAEPERTRTVPAQKVDAPPARSFDWPKIRRYAKNATLALLIAIKLVVVIVYVIRLNASHSFQE